MEKLKTDWKNFLLYLLLIAGAFLILALFFSKEKTETNNQQNVSTESATMKGKYTAPPQMSINSDKNYTAVVVTSQGNFTVELFAKETPVTVNNFVFLSR